MNITRAQFEQQGKPRFGNSNPEQMRNGYWEWMVRTKHDPYQVREHLGLGSNIEGFLQGGLPDFCFKRFGRTQTRMPDGRIICIGGEHEDFYDPDFCIYNDAVVLRPDPGSHEVTEETGTVEIYGYPKHVFPPTDFHSATLVDGAIYLIGSLGYADQRKPGVTPVFRLDAGTLAFEALRTRGENPGWIHGHSGGYEPDKHAIVVRSGQIVNADNKFVQNTAAFRLHFDGLRWERVASDEHFGLFLLQPCERYEVDRPADAFRPRSISHEWIMPSSDSDAGPVRQIVVEGVRISFDDHVGDIEVRIEGEISRQVLDQVLTEISANLFEQTGVAYTFREGTRSEYEYYMKRARR